MIPYGRHYIDEDDIQAVVDLLRNGPLTQGPMVDAFEAVVAEYTGAKHAVAVASCTAGLHLAAEAVGMGSGKTLLTSPITFVASSNAGLYTGGSVGFADVDPETVNLSPAALEEALARHPDTRVVSPVHFGGLPCDMPAIKAAADRAGAVVIEDAAHALGATLPSGERVGSCSHSLAAVFSFHPVKLVAAGEGGVITTNDTDLYRRLLRLRSHGINKLDDAFELPEQSMTGDLTNPWYNEVQELGYHFRITDIQCALGLSQFGKIDRFITRRRELARAYDAAFADDPLIRPAQPEGRERSGHHIYVLRVDFAKAGVSRAQVMHRMRERGIITQVHYIPVPVHPYYRKLGFNPDDFPVAQAYYEEALTIPLYYSLTDEEQLLIVESLRESLR
ncbi:MAG: UDP-4-amino-4,6-dideoxy-N-acetyl-beta-L-altrosamine transaminase [Chloroflexi bacterium]|nr:UDP-4-amino-4,6-dideoxy-N-acetyl-beta-L-altrosamine transaminase [Gemmatimonadota bacterium]MDA1010068.1 UDP-4-amino-4,6-dideoxy-N-acetyl-beta-L-altrosamine transaminase [Chloroflexota bacterium]